MSRLAEGDTLRALVGEDDDRGTELQQQSDGDADHVSAQGIQTVEWMLTYCLRLQSVMTLGTFVKYVISLYSWNI